MVVAMQSTGWHNELRSKFTFPLSRSAAFNETKSWQQHQKELPQFHIHHPMQPSGVAKFTSHQTVNYRTRTRNQTLTEEHVALQARPSTQRYRTGVSSHTNFSHTKSISHSYIELECNNCAPKRLMLLGSFTIAAFHPFTIIIMFIWMG